VDRRQAGSFRCALSVNCRQPEGSTCFGCRRGTSCSTSSKAGTHRKLHVLYVELHMHC
jgi:hypothetical protein